jgi:hypothetical protein
MLAAFLYLLLLLREVPELHRMRELRGVLELTEVQALSEVGA